MRYEPTVVSNVWTTRTTTNNNNGGLDSQEAFKQGVLMLEQAIDEYESPKLLHLVLTGSDIAGYTTFVDKLKRQLREKAKVSFAYKACIEYDSKKLEHMHLMLVVNASEIDSLFNQDEESLISDLLWNINTDGDNKLESFLCQPKRYRTNYIPLSNDTLQCAADYLSYIFKSRSKVSGHKYLSSRKSRRTIH